MTVIFGVVGQMLSPRRTISKDQVPTVDLQWDRELGAEGGDQLDTMFEGGLITCALTFDNLEHFEAWLRVCRLS